MNRLELALIFLNGLWPLVGYIKLNATDDQKLWWEIKPVMIHRKLQQDIGPLFTWLVENALLINIKNAQLLRSVDLKKW